MPPKAPAEDPLHPIGPDGKMACDLCGSRLKPGRGGYQNIRKTHEGTNVCKEAQRRRSTSILRDQNIFSMMRFPRSTAAPVPVPSTTPAPVPLQSQLTPLASSPSIQGASEDAGDTSNRSILVPRLSLRPQSPAIARQPPAREPSVEIIEGPVSERSVEMMNATPALGIVDTLRDLEEQLRPSFGSQQDANRRDDPLAYFRSADPASLDDPSVPTDDLWENSLNLTMKAALGWSTDTIRGVEQLLTSDGEGMRGLIRFVDYFVNRRGVNPALFEGKLSLLVSELRQRYPVRVSTSQSTGTAGLPAVSAARPNVPKLSTTAFTSRRPFAQTPLCPGFRVTLPPEIFALAVYPFGMHLIQPLPWRFEFIGNDVVLRALDCVTYSKAICAQCKPLRENTTLEGIIRRFTEGVHKKSNYAYFGIADLLAALRRKDAEILHLKRRGLTQARALVARSAGLEDHKRFMVALATGKVGNVERLVRVGLRHKDGIRGLIQRFDEAAMGLYKPKDFDEKDDMRALLLWKLGGNRIASIAHRALGLPSVSTLRTRNKMPPLIVSHTQPTVEEVTTNIMSCFEGIEDVLRSFPVIHVNQMLDEVATEKRIRWDDSSNNFLGVCREHGSRVALSFNTVEDVVELFRALKEGEIHYSGEATVGALGVMSHDSRIYSARPVLLSGDCKQESGAEHLAVIETMLDAVAATQSRIPLRVVCVSSDGETRRGSSLIRLTFKRQLAPTSNIYDQLKNLIFMDLHVGDDDLTCDKDWKHIDKRIRNALLRPRGIVVRDVRITPAIIEMQLKSAGLTAIHVKSVLNPDDKQDVKLAFDLLKDIWSLPVLTEHKNPSFLAARNALNVLGQLYYHFLFPFLCTELSLGEQLEHLSAAAHLALALFHLNRTDFMATLLYQDIALTLKNIYFSVAKAKVDLPDSNFYIILLGTDRLEELFGILRTMIGTDANVDMKQIGERLSGVALISAILAKHPEWDRAPRRLRLPALTRDSKALPDTVDHIKPASWKGDVNVRNVTLLTSWNRGRRTIEQGYAWSVPIFQSLEAKKDITILAPYGRLLVTLPPTEVETDDSRDLAITTSDSISIARGIYDDRVEIEDAIVEADSAEYDDTFATNTNMSAPPAPSHPPSYVPWANSQSSQQQDTDTEIPQGRVKVVRHIVYQGAVMLKSRALALYIRSIGKPGPSSTDRLKRVQDIGRYAESTDAATEEAPSSQDVLLIQDPVAALVRCEGHIFLCIGEVNGIKVDTNAGYTSILHDDLAKQSGVTISVQLLGLRQSTTQDDPTNRMDWRSYRIKETTIQIPGRFIEPINPETVCVNPSTTFFLFQGSFLVATAETLLAAVTRMNIRSLPQLSSSPDFPYRERLNKACFACRSETGELDDISGTLNSCSLCSPPFEFRAKKGARPLEHIGAHILFDKSLVREEQPCGICLRPAARCRIFLGRSGTGQPNVNMSKTSGCGNMNALGFRYSVAAESTDTSPCSNVPIPCPICPAKLSPAVWRYNMEYHLRIAHPESNIREYKHLYELSTAETASMKVFWNDRKNPITHRTGKNKVQLVISDAHVSTRALAARQVFLQLADDLEDPVPVLTDLVEDYISDVHSRHDTPASNVRSSQSQESVRSELSYVTEPCPEGVGSPHEMHESGMPPVNETEHGVDGDRLLSEPLQQLLSPPSIAGQPSGEPPAAVSDGTQSEVPVLESDGRRYGLRRKAPGSRAIEDLKKCTGCDVNAYLEPKNGNIQCANKTCTTQWYHLECVGLDRPMTGWFCESCEPLRGNKRARRDRG